MDIEIKMLSGNFFETIFNAIVNGALGQILLVFLVLITVLIVAFLIFRSYLRKKSAVKFSFHNAILLITLPKYSSNDQEKKKSLEELLQPMEKLFDSLGGLKAQRGWRPILFGRSDHFSLEIVADKTGVISFYVVIPRDLQRFTEQQIQAQYPDANIEESEDYNIFLPQGVIQGTILKLKKYNIFPIKTYLKSEVDPLGSVLNSLSKLGEGETAVIQIVARSARPNWRQAGVKVASTMHQGCSLSQAIKKVYGGAGGFNENLKGFSEMAFGGSVQKQDSSKSSILPKEKRKLSPMEEEIVKALEEKGNKAGMDLNLRIVVSTNEKEKGKIVLNNIINAFSQYTAYESGNGFKSTKVKNKQLIRNFIYRIFNSKNKMVLNSEEMASIFHFPLTNTDIPNLKWLNVKRIAAPIGTPSDGVILGKNIYQGEEKFIRLKRTDRQRHLYTIGKTGVGKSWLLINMVIQDIKNGDGICFIDPHGDAIEAILEHIPKERAEDVVYFNPADTEHPMGLNLLEYDPQYPEQKTFVINEMIKIMDKLYDLRQTGGPMFEQYMRNAMLLIMDHPESGSTLMEISKVLTDPDFRKFKLSHCNNPVVQDFWTKEAEKAGGEAALSNMTPYITSKLNQFIANDIMRPIIGQQTSAFNFREIMDNRKIFLINLSKGRIGDMNANLLGMVLMGKILMAAMSRTDMPEEERKDFYLYIDEFQNFTTDTINVILAEARKYRLCLNLAHQYIGQLVKGNDTSIRDAVFGTVGTLVAFKVGMEDAEKLAKEFEPVINQYDLVNVEKFNAYVKLLVDNQSLAPFNIQTIKIEKGDTKIADVIKELSCAKYGKDRKQVEAEIESRKNTSGGEDKEEGKENKEDGEEGEKKEV